MRKQTPDLLMYYALHSPGGTYDQLFLKHYGSIYVTDVLKRIAGVGNINEYGADFGLRIWLDPTRMAMHGVTVNDVMRAVREQNAQVPAGTLGQYPAPAGQAFQYSVQVQGRLADPEEFLPNRTRWEGCVVEPPTRSPAWRIEWGEPHRNYIAGRELRILGEVDAPRELSAMVLTRELKDQMEKLVFEQYVEYVQTRLDTETPAEMRWLVLYSQLGAAELGRLAERYAAVGSIKGWTAQWLAGKLNDALAATTHAAAPVDPMVLMLTRGRLTLRTSMAAFDEQRTTTWLSEFEHALSEAGRMHRPVLLKRGMSATIEDLLMAAEYILAHGNNR